MKTLIKNVIAVLAFMILGHFAVTAQVITADSSFVYVTEAEMDYAEYSTIIGRDGSVYVAFRQAGKEYASGTITIKDNCNGITDTFDYTNNGFVKPDGTLVIQITESVRGIVILLDQNISIVNVKSNSSGAEIEPALPNLSKIVYNVVNDMCPQCEFEEPTCKVCGL